jgi:hypothetical protein
VLCDGTIGGEDTLGVREWLKPLHAPFSLAGRLVGVFSPMVQIAVPPVFDARQDLPLGSAVALQLIGDDPAWDARVSFEELAEKVLRGRLIAPALDKNIHDVAVLIHGLPQAAALPIYRQKHRLEVPFVPGLRAATMELMGIRLTDLTAPLPKRFEGHCDAACTQQLLNISVAEAKAEIQPDAVADELGREAVMLGAISG